MASRSVVSFFGLDGLCLELAFLLVQSGYKAKGFERTESSARVAFVELGGEECTNPLEAARDASIVFVSFSEEEMDDVFFKKDGAVKGLCKDAVIVLLSTVSMSYLHKLKESFADESGIMLLLDAFVFQAVSEDFKDKIIVVASGDREALHKAHPVFSAVSQKVFAFEGEVGIASKIRAVNFLLEGIHLVASLEAIFLGVRAGCHPTILYDIISNAAGSSWIFMDAIPKLLTGDHIFTDYLRTCMKNTEFVMDLANKLFFPLPVLAMAFQGLINGSIGDKEGASASSENWEKTFGLNLREVAKEQSYNPVELANDLVTMPKVLQRIGFIGLGAMGFGMASCLLKSNFPVHAYDIYKPALSRFADLGGIIGDSPGKVAKDAEVLIIMVANESQAESVLYGESGSVSALPDGATIVLSSTLSPDFVSRLEKRLKDEKRALKLVDAPVSGGVTRAEGGTLTIMASGTDEAFHCAGSILSALSEKLYILKGGCGAASSIKMVNQLLAGVHIAAAAEAMAFAARLGLKTKVLFEVLKNASGYSWMFENRVPHMLEDDFTPYSAVDIFVKDLGIVCNESSKHKISHLISSISYQLFVSASASGWGRYDDAAVVKVYETLTGVKVGGRMSPVNKEDLLGHLPPEWPEDPHEDLITVQSQSSQVLIVLDDDPTGTQTVHDIEVLTEWSVDTLAKQFSQKHKCFFILTNSRSLSTEKAISLIKEICKNVDTASKTVEGINYTVVLRGDSTLRGHFPEEADAAVSVLGEMDAWIICPFFLQGGRYTIDDIHYVADSERLVPAGKTEFAKDAAFGYKSSDLKEWIEEKTKGRVPASSVASISIDLLRKFGPEGVCNYLCSLEKESTCIVNAASERDMAVFAAGMIKAENKGKRFLCRTAASFVSARIGIKSLPPICPSDLGVSGKMNGGLIVVGSYVPKTTKQVEELKSRLDIKLRCVEVSVEKLAMKTDNDREEEISWAAEVVNAHLKACKDTLLMTSRQLITGKSASESLAINYKVSSALVDIVRRITVQPRYIIAKGGITSSDLATKALEARRAIVVGQALPGVPLWKLGEESRHPGVPYIVFPGNVGGNSALAEVVEKWACSRRVSTKDLLLSAEKGGYAVGAFNVYNIEGIEAVVAAAEDQKSPAILQIHPGALKQGGLPLVACCVSAAQHAKVPITVHFDHGCSKAELIEAVELGFDSVMVDGSTLSFKENISFTKKIAALAHAKEILVEAELGRLSGSEDGLTVEEYEARLTDVAQAQQFIDETNLDALAVCIGNVHGKYPASGPRLRLDLLKELRAITSNKNVSLVLHGASGLPIELVKECIALGVRKFNVNTEVRNAYMESLRKPSNDLVHVMESAKEAMKAVIIEKMQLFGSSGKA
ncbi:uncharacterized protein LOC110028552 [Phalaenopsis equestris]|uniref:uncharacterized protein LOC110028552 n=1 Tax=Phalaenopsis equestris TaxID=78828 RepID=UPI0009E28371|nr:uncharacterized protein LOC110028552 [Phalaenopsis equestris]